MNNVVQILLINKSIALMIEVVNSSETLISVYQTMQQNIPEDNHPVMSSPLFQMFQSVW